MKIASNAEQVGGNPPLPPVYDLRGDSDRSDRCFTDVARFCDCFLAQAEADAADLLDAHIAFLQRNRSETLRARGEYALDLLLLGLALRSYGDAAEAASGWSLALARALLWVRRHSAHLKPPVDWMRAGLVRDFLLLHKIRKTVAVCPQGSRLYRTIRWLRASGEFEQVALRCALWRQFLVTLPAAEAEHWIGVCTRLSAWFERQADAALGIYTRGVGDFLTAEYALRGCREDQLFCAQQPVAYHLGMVAAELMNRGLQAAFETAARKVVLLPACMRGSNAERCRARGEKPDLICAGCDPACSVNAIAQRMRQWGAVVYLVPHSSSFSLWLERWRRETDTGVIVVACLLNILPGGLEVRARGIVAQCIPLDFPGCRKHWSPVGISTRANDARLVQIVAETKLS
jgi:hypothetical protein